MTIFRNIFSDLVDRRLWPVALVLVAALIALPVLMLKPASHAPAPTTPVAGNPTPALGTAAVSLSDGSGGPVAGKIKDPFHQLHVPKAATAAGGSGGSGGALGPATPGGDSKGGSTGTDSGGGSTVGSGGGTTGSRSPAPGTVLEVRFGLADGKLAKREVRAGSPLPSPTNPLLVYLGQAKDGKLSAFLVSSDAQPQGDGRCEPDKSICSTLYMKAGQTEFFDVTGPAGTVQYQLEVLRVKD